MAAFKFAPLTLSFALLLLLSRSPWSSAREVTAFTDETVRQRQQQQQRKSSDDIWSPFRARKIGTHVVKRLSGGGGGGGGGAAVTVAAAAAPLPSGGRHSHPAAARERSAAYSHRDSWLVSGQVLP
ncbi:hypothetical protein EUGRSUZ_C02503 [Eucalyptus grandis]|uniref:Uncharacterized protein n=2 Tax=Eucalyptus grandis TaxID=71139 RepID=A0ACC3LHS7_EUCGR|nr:hypothetical protein EUGRSUZ_C02503 [Eucalyptus grandis]